MCQGAKTSDANVARVGEMVLSQQKIQVQKTIFFRQNGWARSQHVADALLRPITFQLLAWTSSTDGLLSLLYDGYTEIFVVKYYFAKQNFYSAVAEQTPKRAACPCTTGKYLKGVHRWYKRLNWGNI